MIISKGILYVICISPFEFYRLAIEFLAFFPRSFYVCMYVHACISKWMLILCQICNEHFPQPAV